jgi:hypothetical protein
MILILSHEEDVLAYTVYRQLHKGGRMALRLDEAELFSSLPLALSIDRESRSGFLQVSDSRIALSDISGILLRPPRVWWPSPEFTFQDQLFVYHETTSAWFCLLSGLDCPLVNRYGLGWWVNDLAYPEQLRLTLAERLGLEADHGWPGLSFDNSVNRLVPTPARSSPESLHIYLVGGHLIPRSPGDRSAAAAIRSQASALRRWQKETGLFLCRLDLIQRECLQVRAVEPFPLFEEEETDLVRRVAAGITELLS